VTVSPWHHRLDTRWDQRSQQASLQTHRSWCGDVLASEGVSVWYTATAIRMMMKLGAGAVRITTCAHCVHGERGRAAQSGMVVWDAALGNRSTIIGGKD
jgi:hypothetical protein